ncbi:MAG: phosphate transport system regulatory protein PhoU [Bacteroidetes bacterium 13_1_20CM_4_60_6]|nr:MAG: phosphate transport system regulatory protein PhoU [Bacteroidetes bacterium 13_1_20CM_4_60_6]
MSQLQVELKSVRAEVIEMWNLVHSQLLKALSALLNSDKDLAREIVMIEKRVNGAELEIDRDCEDIFAIYCPVAIDLRFLLAVLKINTNLERIGDIAEGIAMLIIDTEKPFPGELFEATKIIEMFHESEEMVQQILAAFVQEDSSIARGIFGRDELLDDINRRANDLIIDYLQKYPRDIHQALSVLSIIRRLERVGDQAENIAEEIIFYIEAKVLKHTNKRTKSE